MNKVLGFIKYLVEVATGGVSHDVTFMRGNPIHVGHESVVKQVTDSAAQNGGGHTIFMTRSQDAKKNPLTPEQKIKHARLAFPKANVQLTSADAPTLLHQASKLHDDGVNNLHVHVGSDRVDEFGRLLNTYNGVKGKHGFFNFNNINIHSVGADRDAEDDAIGGASATKMRAAASSGNRKSFHKMAPAAMTPVQKDAMMTDVLSGMNPPPVEKKVKVKK